MRWISGGLTLLIISSRLLAVEQLAQAKKPTPAEQSAGRAKAKRTTERLDLNQVDLEQLEEDWQSTPSRPSVDVNSSVKVQEIVEPTGEYSYASFGRPDPFSMPDFLAAGASEQTPEGKDIKAVSPLQRYPLADLSVRGIWQLSTGETRAVVSTPKNEGVVVKEGDPISSGKVLSIKRDQMIVRLYRLRADGVREYEDNIVRIGTRTRTDQAVIRLEPGKDPIFPVLDAKPKTVTPIPVVPTPVAPASPMAPALPSAVRAPADAAAKQ